MVGVMPNGQSRPSRRMRHRSNLAKSTSSPAPKRRTADESRRERQGGNKLHVLLVHGMGRTPLSLFRLARHLRRAGHRPEVVGYVAAVERFPVIRDSIRRRLELAARSGRPYAALPLPRHLIMLGTPSRPPHDRGGHRRMEGQVESVRPGRQRHGRSR
jgi:hypothetical protein